MKPLLHSWCTFLALTAAVSASSCSKDEAASTDGGTSSTPVLIKGLESGVTSIAIDQFTACAVVQGQVACWSGVGTTNLHGMPFYFVTLGGKPQIYARSGLLQDTGGTGTALFNGISIPYVTGSNGNLLVNGSEFLLDGCLPAGRMVGSPRTCFRTPFKIPGLTNAVKVISIGGNTDRYSTSGFCAILSDGGIRCWGTAELGVAASSDFGPVAPTGLSGTITELSGGGHVCATTGTGISCWGTDCNGELGSGSITGCVRHLPQAVTGLTGAITGLAAYWYRSCAIDGGALKCWGYLPTPIGKTATPTAITGLASGVTAISLGGGSGAQGADCAIQNGGAYCWGTGHYGEMGDGSGGSNSKATPSPVVGLASGVTAISVGPSNYACAIKSGSLYCWGDAKYDKLGTTDITETCSRADPHPCSTSSKIVNGLSNVTAVATGIDTTCAIAQGAVYCWGANHLGIFGN